MSRAEYGDTVKVHYIGKLEDGRVFDSSNTESPFEFTLGSGKIIQGFEQAILGMSPGESKEVKIPPNKAYGSYRDNMVVEVDRNRLPESLEPKVGEKLQINQSGGAPIVVEIMDVSEDKVTLDANHPLAGKDLIFYIKLIEIMPS